jgi:hypothetical protein
LIVDAFLRRVIRQRQEEQARDYDPSSERYHRYDETWARPEPAPKVTPTRYVLGDMVEGQLAPGTPPPAPKVKHTCWCCGKVRLVVRSKFPRAACTRCSSLRPEQMLEKFRTRQLKEFRERAALRRTGGGI